MRLLIISNMAHYYQGSQIVGWGPTVQEINHLSTLFDQVRHICCLHDEEPPNSSLPYNSDKITLVPLPPAGGNKLIDKLGVLRLVPSYLLTIIKELNNADVVHLRCPANIPLIGLIVLLFRRNPKIRWVKYAGNWNTYPGQALSYKFQRLLLNQNFHRGVVTINGHWPNQRDHIFTFINPSFSKAEYLSGIQQAEMKQLEFPVELLFVGYLDKAKGVDQALQIAKELNETGFKFKFTFVGDGPERANFELFVQENSLEDHVQFAGWQPITNLHKYYKNAHFLVFPSRSEGWPKVLSEAMAHGVVPLASSISSIPEILGKTGAGLAMPQGNPQAYIEAILKYTQDIGAWKKASINGIKAGKRFTYEHYLADIKIMFKQYFHIELTHE